jgi:Domain of unknown function (DUF4824)
VKLHWSNRTGLLVGLALIVITNVIALSGVAYNRSGEAQGALALTERELPIVIWSWPDNDNSSVDLRLEWRVRETYSSTEDYGSEDWLTEEQLRSLGFDVTPPTETDETLGREDASRPVFLALEYDGPAYQDALEQRRKRVERATGLAARNVGDAAFEEQLEAARKALANEEEYASRLFVIDASLDPEVLRQRYSDRTRYSIVRGRLRTHVAGSPGKLRIAASPPELDIEQIRVPHPYRSLVEPLRERRPYTFDEHAPRFVATVNFGRRLEPWIVQMKRM